MIAIKNPNISTNRYNELLRIEKYYKKIKEKHFKYIEYTKGNENKLFDKIEEQDKEIERLNNIINELEKYLKNRNSFFNEMFRDYGTHHDLLDENENILDKLKELRESGNNE